MMTGSEQICSIQFTPLGKLHTHGPFGYHFSENRPGSCLAVVGDRAIVERIAHRLIEARTQEGLVGSLHLLYLDMLETGPCPVLDRHLDSLGVQETLFWAAPPPRLHADFERLQRDLFGSLMRKMTLLEMIEPAGFWLPGQLPAAFRAWPDRLRRLSSIPEDQLAAAC